MRPSVLICIITCLSNSLFSQVDDNDSVITIKHGRIKGIVIQKSYEMLVNDGVEGRFSPTEDEVLAADKIIWRNIKKLNRARLNQNGGCPVIHRRYYSYFRQYVGVVNKRGEKIIHIQFLWNRYSLWERIRGIYDDRDGYYTEYWFISDGCSRYWSINVNLITLEPFGFIVNGPG